MSIDGLSWSLLRALPGLEGRRARLREQLAGRVLALQESLGTDEHVAAVEALCSLLQWPVFAEPGEAPRASSILIHPEILENPPEPVPGLLQVCVVRGPPRALQLPRPLIELRTAICEAMNVAWPKGLGARLARLAPRVADTPFTAMTWLSGALPIARRPGATDEEIAGAGLARLLIALLARVEPRVAAWMLALAVDPLFPRPGEHALQLGRDAALELAFSAGLVEGYPGPAMAGELDLRRPLRVLGELNARPLRRATQAALAPFLAPETLRLLDVPADPTPSGPEPKVARLVGREAELERLESLCEPGEQARILVLHGPPGRGKHALAAALGERVGAQRMVRLDLRVGPARAWAAIAASLGLPAQIELPERKPPWLDGLFERLRPMELVLVIEGVEAIEALSDWLPSGPGRLVVLLLSDRWPLELRGEALDIPLFPLSEGDADRMLQSRAEALSAKERRSLLPFLEGLPGRIRLAGMALGHMTAPELRERLTGGGERALAEAALADWSPAERFVGGVLSLVPPRVIPEGSLQSLSGPDPVAGAKALRERGVLEVQDAQLALDPSVARALVAVQDAAEKARLERALAFGALDSWLLAAQQGGAAESELRPLLNLVAPWLERWMNAALPAPEWQKLALASQWLADRVDRGHAELLSPAIALSRALGEHHPEANLRAEFLRQEADNRTNLAPFQPGEGHTKIVDCCERGLALAGGDARLKAALLNTLGNGQKAFGEWQAALDAYSEALEASDAPDVRAGVLSNLSTVWQRRPDGDRLQNQRKAVDYADQARRAISEQGVSERWSKLQINWASAVISQYTPSVAEILEAIQACAHALAWISPLQSPAAWATGQLNLGFALGRLNLQTRRSLVERSAWAYLSGLAVAQPSEQPVNWAKLSINLASCQLELGEGHPYGGPSHAKEAMQEVLSLPGLPAADRENAELILAMCWASAPTLSEQELERAEAIFQRARAATDQKLQPEIWADHSLRLARLTLCRIRKGERPKPDALQLGCAEVLALSAAGPARHREAWALLASAAFLEAQRGDAAGWTRGLEALTALLRVAPSQDAQPLQQVLQILPLWRPNPELAELDAPIEALLSELLSLSTRAPALAELVDVARFQLISRSPPSIHEKHAQSLRGFLSTVSASLTPTDGSSRQMHIILTPIPLPQP